MISQGFMIVGITLPQMDQAEFTTQLGLRLN